jgi:hypothetical protein
MMTVRKAADRGHFDHGWLDTFHTFSFGDYHDPGHVRFRSLRVLNEDVVQAGAGFDMHPHKDMEILTFVLEGALRHEDSMGNGDVIRPGDVQRMSAGTGVMHSEWNASEKEPVHLLQVWILPEKSGLAPGYEQITLSAGAASGGLRRVASRKPGKGEVTVHQDAAVYTGSLRRGEAVEHALAPGRGAWVQVASGSVVVDGTPLAAGDGAAVEGVERIRIETPKEGSVLLFDMA